MWDEISAKIADSVSTFPVTSISVSILFCFIFSSGLKDVRFEHDIRRSFSPEDSVAGYETRAYLEYLNLTQFPQKAFVVFKATDGGNLLRKKQREEILRFDALMMEHLNLRDVDGRKACEPLCGLNLPYHYLMKELNSTNHEGVLGYPDSTLDGIRMFLGMHLHSVTFKEPYDLDAKIIILWYFSRIDSGPRQDGYKNLTLSLFETSKQGNFSDDIYFYIFGDEIANHEMVRGAMEAIKLMGIGFVFLLIFVIGVVARQAAKRMVPYLVAATLITPLMSAISAFGILTWFGYPIYTMQCVTPFLVLGIGVDDAFILIHRWRQRSDLSSRRLRLRGVIVDVGPSITITSITNIIAFGVGFFTPTPQMSLFCLLTSVALLIDYILTYSLLSPIVFLCNAEDEQVIVPTNDENSNKKAENQWLKKYSSFVCSLSGRLFCGIIVVLLYSFSAIGVFTMKSSFEPIKAFPSDSHLVNAIETVQPVFDEFFPVNIYVRSPPVISDAVQYKTLYKMIGELEQVKGAHSRNRTILFLDRYEEFDRKVSSLTNSFFFAVDSEYKPSLKNLQFWLDKVGNPSTVKYRKANTTDGEGVLEAFQIILFGHGMAEWSNRAQFEESIRHILNQYPQFNASIFDGDSAVLSLILTVRLDLIGSIAVTVACMAIVCLLFLRNKMGVFIITFIIAAICFNLVGCLSWWGSDLDPVTQVDVLLATGFSVDYTAHIAYQYYRGIGSPETRIYNSLREMAAPMIQAGVSTFLCMLPLILIKTYAIVAFAKTVFLVVGIGLIHGLLILPVLVTLALPYSPEETEEEIVIESEKCEPLLSIRPQSG